jgi:hypothetical protein
MAHGRGSYGVGIAESVRGAKACRTKRITMVSSLFGSPFFGTNPLDGAQPALNEWFGLKSPTEKIRDSSANKTRQEVGTGHRMPGF